MSTTIPAALRPESIPDRPAVFPHRPQEGKPHCLPFCLPPPAACSANAPPSPVAESPRPRRPRRIHAHRLAPAASLIYYQLARTHFPEDYVERIAPPQPVRQSVTRQPVPRTSISTRLSAGKAFTAHSVAAPAERLSRRCRSLPGPLPLEDLAAPPLTLAASTAR